MSSDAIFNDFNTAFRIRVEPYIDSPNSFLFEPMIRDLYEFGPAIPIGRFDHKSPSETDTLAFRSKVVSRKHALIWVEAGGKFFIKDTGSSSGTFLNNARLSDANRESRPVPLKNGDIVQIGVDIQGVKETFGKSVKIKVELGRAAFSSPTMLEKIGEAPIPSRSPYEILPLLVNLLKKKPINPSSSNVELAQVRLMSRLLSLRDYGAVTAGLGAGSDVELLLDFIIYLLDKDFLPKHIMPDANRRARQFMFRLFTKRPVTPKSLFITGVTEEGFLDAGGFGYVFKGKYKGEKVVMKMLKERHSGGNSESLIKNFCREALAWRSLSHQYILPLLGIFQDSESKSLYLISPFMTNGTLAEWRRAGQKSVGEIRQRIFEVGEGVRYIHSEGIVHGDLRGDNVLLDDSFRSRIADFGLTRHGDVTRTGSDTAKALHFAAPELFGYCIRCNRTGCSCSSVELKSTHKRKHTHQTDVYAFGCIYYEIFFGTAPFANLREAEIIRCRGAEKHPERLETPGMTDIEWELIQRCWVSIAAARPSIKRFVKNMESIMHS